MLLTKYWSIDLLMGFGLLVVLAYLYMTRKFKYWKNLGVMGPEPTPFVGNFSDCFKMKKSAGEWLQDLYNWGAGLPYIGFYVFDQPFFLARDPEIIKNILVKDFNYFQDRFVQTSSEDRLGDANLFLIKNPAWKYLRAKITPIYTSGRLKKMFELMTEVSRDLNAHMTSLPWNGDNIVMEMKELCSKYTTDLIGTTAFGLKVNSLNNPDAEFRKRGRAIFNFTFYRNIEVTSMFFAPHIAKSLKFQFFSPDTSNFLRTAVWDTLNERERSGIKRGDLIDLLLELKKTQAPGPEKELFDFDGDNLVAQAAVFFTAGYETSGTTLSFTLYELARHQDIQSKLRNEIAQVLQKSQGKVTYDLISELSYLDMVVSETLRKYPPLPVLDRVAAQDYQVPNSKLILRKGTPVYISVFGLHFDPQYFPNPQKYDPERFSPEKKKKIPSGVYLPFGDGPHACIGLRIGLLQVKLGLIELIQKFEFSPCEKTLVPMRLNPKALITASDGGIFLNVRKITSNILVTCQGNKDVKMTFLGDNWGLEVVILVVLIIYLIYRYMMRNSEYWKNRGVVYLPPTSVFGNFGEFLLGKTSAGCFTKMVYDYAPNEPYVGFFILDQPMLMIRDPEIVKQILIKDFDYFKDRYANAPAYDVIGTSNLFVLKNPAWKFLRHKISPIYTSGRLRKMLTLMIEVGHDLVTYMESLNLEAPGRELELKDICARFTTDMIATTAFGLRANSLNNPNAEFRESGKEFFRDTFYRSVEHNSGMFAPYLMSPLGFHFFPKKFSQFMRMAVWGAINEREKSGFKRHDLIDLLTELKNAEFDDSHNNIFEFKGDNIVAQAAVFFAAGFETSSTTISFSLYELSLKPEVQRRVRKEIIDAVEGNHGEITYDMIMRLPYLDMVVSETLRKYPPLPLLDRIADADYAVPGTDLIIEKGTPVYITLTGLHYDPKYHKDPEIFDPERFSEINKEATKQTWYPFGDGPHVCIGQRLGLAQSKLGLIELLRRYEFSPSDRTPIPMVLNKKGVMTSAEGGLYLHVKKLDPQNN
ncbi:uncharacterized protein [Fopius arisanus]|uniref:Uncharacterized protein n=4 Tax=Fopius arisanus TaxID=64838 RepID=A0A9R1T9D1_9HYME|nr:PREDICTED: uncharacterized protein LOC105267828 [Fopius arisanus]